MREMAEHSLAATPFASTSLQRARWLRLPLLDLCPQYIASLISQLLGHWLHASLRHSRLMAALRFLSYTGAPK